MRSRKMEPFPTEYALLGFLTESPRHGYDIYQELADPEGLWMVWRMKQSQLYALLARLEERGYLTSSLEPQGGRPPRKMYQLTQPGQEAYSRWLEAPVERGRQFRLDLLAKLFFAHRAGRAAVEKLLEAQRAVCRRWLCDLQATLEENGDGDSFRRLVHYYRAGQVQAMLDWLDTCQDERTPSILTR